MKIKHQYGNISAMWQSFYLTLNFIEGDSGSKKLIIRFTQNGTGGLRPFYLFDKSEKAMIDELGKVGDLVMLDLTDSQVLLSYCLAVCLTPQQLVHLIKIHPLTEDLLCIMG